MQYLGRVELPRGARAQPLHGSTYLVELPGVHEYELGSTTLLGVLKTHDEMTSRAKEYSRLESNRRHHGYKLRALPGDLSAFVPPGIGFPIMMYAANISK